MADVDRRRLEREAASGGPVEADRAMRTNYRAGIYSGPSPHYHLVPKDLDANLRFRRDLLMQTASDPDAASQIRTMCKEDLLFYVSAFVWTFDPRAKVKVVPFIPYDFQDEAMLTMVECIEIGQDVAVPKSRDMGASWMGLTVFEWMWHFQSDLVFLIVSRNEDYVDKRGNPKALFWKIDFIHKHLPQWLLPTDRWLGDRDPNRKLLHLANADNNSVIDGESTTGDAGRGDRRTAMFIDEHAAFDLADGFKVLNATRSTTTCRIFNSTPQGANNAFYEVVHKTNARVLRLHWSQHPIKKRGLYTTDRETGRAVLLDNWRGVVTVTRRGEPPKSVAYPEDYPFDLDVLDPRVRSPWYDSQCSRCVSPQEVAQELDIDFLGSAFPFFDPRFIEVLKAQYAREPTTVGDLEYDRGSFQPKQFREDKNGLIQLWMELGEGGRPAKDRQFVLGADISAGTGASNSVCSVADRETGEKVAVLRTPHLRPHPFAGLAMALAHFFNGAYMVWDASGPTGKVFTKRLIEEGYGDIYYRRYEKKVTRRISDEPGYYLNPQARNALLEDYRAALSDHRFINRSEQGLIECLQFIRRPDGGVEHSASANSQDPSGARTAHGDEVIADALCCLGVYERQALTKADEPQEPPGSLAWRRKRAREAMAPAADRLGEGW